MNTLPDSTPEEKEKIVPLLETEDYFADTQQRTPDTLPGDWTETSNGSCNDPTQKLADRLAGHRQPVVRKALEEGVLPEDIADVLARHGLDF